MTEEGAQPLTLLYASTDHLRRYISRLALSTVDSFTKLVPTTSSFLHHIQYPLAAQRAFATSLAPKTPSGKPFRFVLLSGAAIVRDQTTRLPPGLSGLKQRGQVEQDFVDFEAQNPKVWKSFIARPRMVIMPGSWVSWAIPGGFQIPVEVLGAALVSVVVHGDAEQTLDNVALTSIGRAAMAGK